MSNENLGIEKLKSAAKELIEIGMSVAAATEDGKVTFPEGVQIAWEAKDLVGVAKNWEDIKEEFNDLDSTEMEELKDYITEELDIANDKIETVIEKSIAVVVSIVDMIQVFKNE